MTPVRFVGGPGDGVLLEFPDHTLLPNLYLLPAADGRTAAAYALEHDPEADPPHTYRIIERLTGVA